MSNREIVANHLVKKFGDFVAVNDVSFKVESGEIFGFLGPNGAGKSTIINMLTTLGIPTDGSATVGGFDIIKQAGDVRRIAGVALQEIGLDPIMKSMELLTIQGQAFGMSRKQANQRAEQLLDLVKLSEFTERRVGNYSGGMRRRLDLALALVHEPDILFLDEPTTGLDPASRRDVWQEVRRLNRTQGMTIFLTTQYLEEADELADRIAIIDKGDIVAEGKPDELKSEVGGEAINVSFATSELVERAQSELAGMADRTQVDRKTLRLYLTNSASAVPKVVQQLQQANIELDTLTLTQATLDDVFLKVTGQRYEADVEAEPASEDSTKATV
ncbi:MAG: ATP-binding cassette domain-containing protein [Phototrophicaceae bacterium]